MTKLVGQIKSLSCINDEKMHISLAVNRRSGACDYINVISDYSADIFNPGDTILVDGEESTTQSGSSISLIVKADNIFLVEQSHFNSVFFHGTVCKEPTIRTTPNGRSICNLTVAKNHLSGHSSYFPCICWESSISEARSLSVGDCVAITGRLQSRDYTNSKGIKGRTHEISVFDLRKVP